MRIGSPPTYLGAQALEKRGVHICVFPAQRRMRPDRSKTGYAYKYTLHPSLNEWTRGNPHAIARIKLEWEQWFFDHLRENDFPKITGAPVFCFIGYFFPDDKPRDFDNYAPKFLLDALKKYGAIEDDSDRVLGAHPFIIHRSCPESPHVLVALTKDPAAYRDLIDEFLPDIGTDCTKGT